MAIRLHTFTSEKKRFVQVATQPHHITGLFRQVQRIIQLRGCDFIDIQSAYYECIEDGTVTLYLAQHRGGEKPGIWTYLSYECAEGEENIERDDSLSTEVSSLEHLLIGEKLLQPTTSIEEYLYYMYAESEYLDVELPYHWDSYEGRRIAEQLLIEFTALHNSQVFASGAGKRYAKQIITIFIELAVDVLNNDDSFWDFYRRQHDTLRQIDTIPTARQIVDMNDFLLWQDALPTKSKAVDYVFQAALNLITQLT